MKLTPYILVFICGILCVSVWKGCQADKKVEILTTSVLRETTMSDSLKKVVTRIGKSKDSIVAKNGQDSIIYTSKIDSLTKETKRWKGNFMRTRDSIILLNNSFQAQLLKGDTTGAITTINYLRDQLGLANNQLFQWQIGRDSSENAYIEEINRLRGVIADLLVKIDGFKEAFDAQFKSTQVVTNDFMKLKKREKFESLLIKIEPAVILLLAAGLFIHK